MLPNDGGFRQLVVNGRTLLCLYRGEGGILYDMYREVYVRFGG